MKFMSTRKKPQTWIHQGWWEHEHVKTISQDTKTISISFPHRNYASCLSHTQWFSFKTDRDMYFTHVSAISQPYGWFVSHHIFPPKETETILWKKLKQSH
jgi:hypothetical protein